MPRVIEGKLQDAFIDLDIKNGARPERIRAMQARSELTVLLNGLALLLLHAAASCAVAQAVVP